VNVSVGVLTSYIPVSGLSKRDLLKSVDELEGAYYIVDDFFCPRHLNPSFTFYWIATFLIEFMYQKVSGNPNGNVPVFVSRRCRL
jgi:hypothetical protein